MTAREVNKQLMMQMKELTKIADLFEDKLKEIQETLKELKEVSKNPDEYTIVNYDNTRTDLMLDKTRMIEEDLSGILRTLKEIAQFEKDQSWQNQSEPACIYRCPKCDIMKTEEKICLKKASFITCWECNDCHVDNLDEDNLHWFIMRLVGEYWHEQANKSLYPFYDWSESNKTVTVYNVLEYLEELKPDLDLEKVRVILSGIC